MDRREKAVALAGHGFDETRILRVILDGGAEFLQGGVEATVKIDVGSFGPQRLAKLFARDDLTGPLKEQRKDAEGLFLDFDACALAGKQPRRSCFSGSMFSLEGASALFH